MKRLVALAILCTMAMGSFAQNVNDVWLLLQNGNIPGAKKKIEECMPSNQNNAMAWLYRGNVYMQIYDRDQSRLEKNPSYISKDPEAAFIAYESFFKALELDPKIKEKTPGGLVEPTFGQITMGGPIYNMGVAAYKAKDVEKAEKYFRAAVKCFNLDPAYKEYAGSCYYQLAIIKQNDKEAYKEVLDEAVNAKTNLSLLYQLAYDYYDKANVTVTLTATTDGTTPITNVTYTPSGTSTAAPLLFQSTEAAGTVLTTEAQNIRGCFTPAGITSFVLKSTYDVYDRKGNLIRPDQTAENTIDISKVFTTSSDITRGKMFTINMTIKPTYLYVLSDPDLDNPTFEID